MYYYYREYLFCTIWWIKYVYPIGKSAAVELISITSRSESKQSLGCNNLVPEKAIPLNHQSQHNMSL